MSHPYEHSSSSASDIIYYDLMVTNLKSEALDDNQQILKFSETRQVPIVEKANDYYLSIVRFQIDTFNLPVYYAEIQPNQADPNKMIHSFTLEYQAPNGTIYQSTRRFLSWTQNDYTKTVPPAPSSNPNGLQSHSPYYYAYSYTHLLKILNTTLVACITDIYQQINENTLLFYPFFAWNADSYTISFYGTRNLYESTKLYTDPPGKMTIYFNANMYALLNGFPVKKYGVNNPNGKHYELIVDSFNGANAIPGNNIYFGTYQGIKINQEYSTTMLWSPVAALVFATSTLPITPNQLSAPYIYQDGQLVQYSSQTNQSLNIITDMVTDSQSYKPSLLYIPTAEYRYINLFNNSPITNIDIQCYWRSKLNEHYPMMLPSGGTCTMKLLFKKRFV